MGSTAKDVFENNARLWGHFLRPEIERALDPLGLAPPPLVEASAQLLTESAATVAAGAMTALAPPIRGLFLDRASQGVASPCYAPGQPADTETLSVAAEDSLAPLLEQSPFLLLAVDQHGVITRSEGRAIEHHGVLAAEAVGRSVFDLYADQPALLDALRLALAGEACAATLHVGGSAFEVHLGPLFDVQKLVAGVVGVGVDVSGRERAHHALRESEERYRTLVETSPDAIILTDLEDRILIVNDQAVRLHGCGTVADLVGKSSLDFIAPEDRASVAENARLAIESGEIRSLEYTSIRCDGSRCPVELNASLIRDRLGNPTALVGVVRDLSARKRTEAELRQALELRDRIMESVPNGIATLDVAGRFTHVNRRVAEITGYSQDELIGRHLGELLPPDLVEAATSPVSKVMSEAASISAAEIPLTRPDGTKRTVRFSIGPLRAEGEIIGAVATAEDITEQRQLEQRFAQAQKMEAVGRLAGGLAHDMNNLMTAVIGYSELVMEALPRNGRIYTQVEQIHAAGERAVNTSSRLLALARRQVIQPKVVDLNDLIFDIHRTLGHLIGEDIELALLPTRGLHAIEIDPGQFEQVLLNLAVNARDAMPHGGKLVIQTANLSVPEHSDDENSHAADWVLLTVSDTGTGMDEDVKRHLFEPFFTTKEVGKGTGLGLATCYGIISQAGGRIEVESAPAEGAIFRIYLPASKTAPSDDAPAQDAGYLPGGTDTILLVEDEDSVRELAAFVLGQQGYNVLTAPNGREGVRVARRHIGEIDLLLTDVVMPEMGGRELADCLRITQPKTRVLFMSGYAADDIVHRGVIEQQVNFLEKPFSPLALLRKVRDVLDDELSEPPQADRNLPGLIGSRSHAACEPSASSGSIR